MTISKEEVLARLHQLPSMSVVVQEVMASFSNENLNGSELANMIARDQGLSAKILRVANSSFYGLPRKIASVHDAVVVMGFNSVRSLVLSAGFVHAFPAMPGSRFDRAAYWKHSFRVAGYAKALAQTLHQEPHMTFTAAMFHEVGQLALDVCIPEQFAEVLQQQEVSGQSLAEVELSQLGFDHAMIGAEIARYWNFPAEIEDSIHYWTMPERQPYRALNGIVYAAVLLESGLRDADFFRRLPEAVSKNMGLSWERIEASLPDSDELDAGAALLLAA